jgi:hypothetical protein
LSHSFLAGSTVRVTFPGEKHLKLLPVCEMSTSILLYHCHKFSCCGVDQLTSFIWSSGTSHLQDYIDFLRYCPNLNSSSFTALSISHMICTLSTNIHVTLMEGLTGLNHSSFWASGPFILRFVQSVLPKSRVHKG